MTTSDAFKTSMLLFLRTSRASHFHDAVTEIERLLAESTSSDQRRSCLVRLFRALSVGYHYLRSPEVLPQLIERGEEALEATPTDHHTRRDILEELGEAFLVRHYVTGDLDDLNQGIARTEEAVALSPSADIERVTFMVNIGRALLRRYDLAGSRGDLQKAAKWIQEAATNQQPNHSRLPDVQHDLGAKLYNRYQNEVDLNDLEEGIRHMDEAVNATLPDHPDLASRIIKLSKAFFSRFKRMGNIQDLESAIRRAKQAEATLSQPSDGAERATIFNNLASLYWCRYETLKLSEDLDEAVGLSQEAVVAMPPNHPGRVSIVNNFNNFCIYRYQRFRVLCDLEKVIERTREALATCTPAAEDPDRAVILNNLSSFVWTKYKQSNSPLDLENAIAEGQVAVATVPPGHPYRPGILHNLSNKIYHRYDLLGDLEDLEKSIAISQEALETIPSESAARPVVLDALAIALLRRYEMFEDAADLEQALTLAEAAQVLAFPGDYQANTLNTLGNIYRTKYERLGTIDDLNNAITTAETAVRTASGLSANQDKAAMLSSLSISYDCRYRQSGSVEDLEKAFVIAEEAMKEMPRSDTSRREIHRNFGRVLRTRYQRFGNLEDIEGAIKSIHEALAIAPMGHPTLPGLLGALAQSFLNKSRQLGTLIDLNQSIQHSQKALAIAPVSPVNHHTRRTILCNYAAALLDRYQRLGALDDLHDAAKFTWETLAATPQTHCTRAEILSNLNSILYLRYNALGDPEDLEQAINYAEEAAIRSESFNKPARLGNFSTSLLCRYERAGAMHDLELAIRLAQEVVATTPVNHPLWMHFSSHLSNALRVRFERTDDIEDLQQAIKAGEAAVERCSPNHPCRADLLNSLGVALSCRSEYLASLEDLDSAIACAEQAVAGTLSDDPFLTSKFTNLGIFLAIRYERLGCRGDLEQAIKWSDKAVACSAPNSPNWAAFVHNLVSRLNTSMNSTVPSAQHFYDALRITLDLWETNTAPPRARIRAARRAAGLLAVVKKWPESASLFEAAVKALPEVSPRFLGREDQQHMLSDFSHLAADAASAALEAGLEAAHCLGLLELGRGIILGFSIDCRSDLSYLRAIHPEVYDKFNILRNELDSLPTKLYSEYDDTVFKCPGRDRKHTAQEMDKTLADIRQLPSLERFQLPPTAQDLMALAKEGPIVVVNSTRFRSDAILVTSSVIKVIQLPKLQYTQAKEKMREMTGELVTGKHSTYPARNRKLQSLLFWLWDAGVEPVLDELKFGPVDDMNLPRIWWIGVGPLSMAPFHAAGDHSSGSTRNTMSRAISSYISTIKTLSYAREKKLELLSTGTPNRQLLLINMPTTPGHKPLQHVIQEVKGISSVIKGSIIAQRLDSPTTHKVLKRLPSSHAVHFACHGISNRKNPSQSHLVLQTVDGLGMQVEDRLTVSAISSVRLRGAQLAYLSACSTADNTSTDFTLSDESIHIAGAFQLAGFSHVLATLWHSNDLGSQQVAHHFYSLLFSGLSSEDEGHRKVSASFHCAVKSLRDKNLRQPIKWATFIHTGA